MLANSLQPLLRLTHTFVVSCEIPESVVSILDEHEGSTLLDAGCSVTVRLGLHRFRFQLG